MSAVAVIETREESAGQGMQAGPAWHQPVMPREVLDWLRPQPGAVVVDGTVGTGGHSALIAPRLSGDGRLIALDRDADALAVAKQRLADVGIDVTCVHGNFRQMRAILRACDIEAVDGLLLDVGMSSVQLDEAIRGFSFSREGPLDMRMDATQTTTAAELVNRWNAEELTDVLERLGEERFAKRIAHQIVLARRRQPIATTTQLARLVWQAVPACARHGRLHPATRTFQALRMAVNDELGALEALLAELAGILKPAGRAVIIAFHSLEDRMVKRAFVQGAREGLWSVLTKKPVRPSDEEVAQNPRARSAKLRAIERR